MYTGRRADFQPFVFHLSKTSGLAKLGTVRSGMIPKLTLKLLFVRVILKICFGLVRPVSELG